MYQKTVAARISCRGEALHFGGEVEMSLAPAPPDTGLVFCRLDLPGRPTVTASPTAVVDTRRAVALGQDGWRINTVEHLLAAAHGLGIDNLLVEVDGPELPMGDGSARYFVDLILRAGVVSQERPRRVRVVEEPLWAAEDGSYLVLLPSERPGLTVNYVFTADRRPIPTQYCRFHLGEDDFTAAIAPARTIAFLEEIEALRREGLARSNDCTVAVVVGPEGYLGPLRFPDEIARHKVLDLLGDLYLVGPVYGQVLAVRSGHRLNHRLAQRLAALPAVVV
ncbi:MAG: UDP-3-O-[3-hydroxymyristoyl] N-acetylglucosamine deacetylase [Firmicutes bacterium]|nr:UDP-3-O-[3-hydroxymyristoyl] N-acetylglucosamine deacetylase [Bacillota bacterium]